MNAGDLLGSRDWEFSDADTRTFTHGIHRYSGKFIPPIARQAIELLTVPGDLVVDPYCGSGTPLLEGALLGRRMVGFDLNPLAVLISRAKCRRVVPDGLREARLFLADAVEGIEGGSGDLLRAAEADPRSRDKWFKKWFQPHVLSDLLAIDAAISRVEDHRSLRVCCVALSDILRRCSNSHPHYPNVMFDRNAPRRDRPGSTFIDRLEQIASAVLSLPESFDEDRVHIECADARCLPLPDGSADAFITHPPYIGSVPYAEYGVLSLRWMGYDPGMLDRQLTGGRRQTRDVVARFEEGYGGMIAEASRVLVSGGRLFVMVGNPTVRGEPIDLAAMTLRLASGAGLEPVSTAGRRGTNRRANKMGGEALMVFCAQ